MEPGKELIQQVFGIPGQKKMPRRAYKK